MVAIAPISLSAPYVVQPSAFRTTQATSTQTTVASDALAQQNAARLSDALVNSNTAPIFVENGPVPSTNLAADTLLQAQEAFTSVDTDASNSVTLEEFQTGAGVVDENTATNLEALFTQSDLDEDGILSEGEFTNAALYETLSSVVNGLSNPSLQVGTPIPATFYDPRDTNLDGVVDAGERLTDLLNGVGQLPVPDEAQTPGTEETRNSMLNYLISVQEAQQQGLA